MAVELKPIDVICQPSRDGKITPMKISPQFYNHTYEPAPINTFLTKT